MKENVNQRDKRNRKKERKKEWEKDWEEREMTKQIKGNKLEMDKRKESRKKAK